MKLLCTYIIFMLLLLACTSHAQSGNSTLNTEVSINMNKVSKAELLDTLGSKYNLYFSYNPELLGATEALDLSVKDEPLFKVLERLIDKEVLRFKAFDNQVVIFPIESTAPIKETADFLFVSGAVTDQKENDPLPYCNIAIVGKSMGTMSNAEGNFIIKLPVKFKADTLAFSCLGYETAYLPIAGAETDTIQIKLRTQNYKLKTVNVARYNPEFVLDKLEETSASNYEKDYTLLTTFYRELTMENEEYTDISEAVLQVMKAPYENSIKQDHVKFLRGRKGAVEKPINNIRFKLMGGPYYITKLDVVKNKESFIDPTMRHLYNYEFEHMAYIDDRPCIVLSFAPINNLRDVLFKGKLFVDQDDWALVRVEFEYTRRGLKLARNSLIQKEPRRSRAIPSDLGYAVQYKKVGEKWYLLSARSSFKIRIRDREKRELTRFHSVSEVLTTNIEKGDFQQFSRSEVFKANEIFTDKIISYDKAFWNNFNVIKPEEKLVKALKNFDNQNLIITYKN